MPQVATATTNRLLALVRRLGVVRPRDLAGRGVPRTTLAKLVAEGVLERRSRGVYVLADADVTEHHDLAQVCKRVPHGVVCLLSALRFHRMTTQAPHEVWLGIDRKARLPKLDHPPLRVVRFSGAGLTAGVEEHTVEGVRVRVTGPARTVADCFAYRNTVGLEVALEALRDCLRQRRATVDELHRAAQTRRMANVMRPYLEALV
jgi:predicted transcriptional regulator of viral defense system